jgi:GTP-binding protein EngB required for normal cell division
MWKGMTNTRDLRDHAKQLLERLRQEDKGRVRVALFGQPGAGKSSLINALVGQHVAQVGVRTDTTTSCECYEWGQIVLADLPGYGTERFPSETYFDRFDIMSFDLFLCVTANKFTAEDAAFFRALNGAGKPCLFVRNFGDMLWQEGMTKSDLEREVVDDARRHVQDEGIGVLFTGCRTKAGLDLLSRAIHTKLDGAKAERWARSAKAYSHELLEKKFAASTGYIYTAAGLSAANGLNPVPGLDLAADVTILVGLFAQLRQSHGLDQSTLTAKTWALPIVAPHAKRLLELGTVHGIPLLLRRFVKRATLKQVSKYIPIVGQAVAASLGFAVTVQAGLSYLRDCHAVARAILDEELARTPG